MTTLTEFLLARIAEDEAVATEAFRIAEAADPGAEQTHLRLNEVGGNSGYEEVTVGAHRVLAECEAKRRIVERETSARIQHKNVPWASMEGGNDFFRLLDADGIAIAHDERAHQMFEKHSDPITDTLTLRLLAQVYADHPDYDPAWIV